MVVPKTVIAKIGAKKFAENPVGTGPFTLTHWHRGSEILLKRNKNFRLTYLPGKESAADKEKYRLPLADEVSFRIFLEEQPMWLSFLNGELDMSGVPIGTLTKEGDSYSLPIDIQKQGFRIKALSLIHI